MPHRNAFQISRLFNKDAVLEIGLKDEQKTLCKRATTGKVTRHCLAVCAGEPHDMYTTEIQKCIDNLIAIFR